MEYINRQLYKLFKKYLDINILSRKNEKLFDHEEEYDINNLLWQLKGKKLLPFEKKIIRDYKNIFKEKSPQSQSKKRGHISSLTRKIVNKRDGKECRFCGSTLNIELAHIISRGAGGSGEVNNLISLCRKHHQLLDNPVGTNQINERKKLKNFINVWKGGAEMWFNWFKEKNIGDKNENKKN